MAQLAIMESLIPESFPSTQEVPNAVEDSSFNPNDIPDDFLDWDEWLSQNYLTEESTDLDREQTPNLDPPVYAAFCDSREQTLDERSTRHGEHEKPSEASVPALSSLVRKLQSE